MADKVDEHREASVLPRFNPCQVTAKCPKCGGPMSTGALMERRGSNSYWLTADLIWLVCPVCTSSLQSDWPQTNNWPERRAAILSRGG